MKVSYGSPGKHCGVALKQSLGRFLRVVDADGVVACQTLYTSIFCLITLCDARCPRLEKRSLS
jgi:hypothetical protein